MKKSNHRVVSTTSERENEAFKYRQLVQKHRRKAREGNLDSHFWLGCAYSEPRIHQAYQLTPDATAAQVHLLECAKGKHADGTLFLAYLHTRRGTDIVEYDKKRAMALTVTAAKLASTVAREIVEKCYLQHGQLERLLAEAARNLRPLSAGINAIKVPTDNPSKEMPASSFMPETGSAQHPVISRQYLLTRTEWFDGAVEPHRPGVYEWLLKHGVEYALWDGKDWTKCGPAPDQLNLYITNSPATSSNKRSRSRHKHPAWRGLAFNPDKPAITHVPAPGPLLSGVLMRGYVEQYEPESPRVREIHVAKAILSKDGDFLTMCGYMSRHGALRLWCDTEMIKVVDGYQPSLCPVCARRTFSLP